MIVTLQAFGLPRSWWSSASKARRIIHKTSIPRIIDAASDIQLYSEMPARSLVLRLPVLQGQVSVENPLVAASEGPISAGNDKQNISELDKVMDGSR